MCAALRKHTGALRGFSLKGGPNLWLKDIDPKLREKETLRKIQDLQLSCLTQEYLFRTHLVDFKYMEEELARKFFCTGLSGDSEEGTCQNAQPDRRTGI